MGAYGKLYEACGGSVSPERLTTLKEAGLHNLDAETLLEYRQFMFGLEFMLGPADMTREQKMRVALHYIDELVDDLADSPSDNHDTALRDAIREFIGKGLTG